MLPSYLPVLSPLIRGHAGLRTLVSNPVEPCDSDLFML